MPNSFHLEGVVAFSKHDYQTAKNFFLQAIEKNPEEADSYLLLGKAYFFCDEKSAGIPPLNKYIKLNQYNPKEVANVSYAFDLQGQCYEADSKDSEALTCYTTATEINADAASAWHHLGLLFIKSAQRYLEQDLNHSLELFRKAKIFLKTALKICSPNPMVLNSVADWYEKYIEALEKSTEDQETVQNNIDNNFNLAIKYYQKALAACREDDAALKNIITANFSECLAQYGHHLYRAEDFVKASAFYSRAIELDPDHLPAINQLGMSFFKQALFPEARNYFSAILSKTSEPQELADAWLNIACTHRSEKSWVNAENALGEAKKFAPEDPSIRDEEQKLMDFKSLASLITAPQTIFSNQNSVSQSPMSPSGEKALQFNQ